jgi:hypothetical protein
VTSPDLVPSPQNPPSPQPNQVHVSPKSTSIHWTPHERYGRFWNRIIDWTTKQRQSRFLYHVQRHRHLETGAALSGTFTLDKTTGTFSTALLTVVGPPLSLLPAVSNVFDAPEGFFTVPGPETVETINNGGTLTNFAEVHLAVPFNSFVGYPGGPLCSLSNISQGTLPSELVFFSGQLPPGVPSLVPLQNGSAVPVPEPSSILLTLTGLTGFGINRMLARRRRTTI